MNKTRCLTLAAAVAAAGSLLALPAPEGFEVGKVPTDGTWVKVPWAKVTRTVVDKVHADGKKVVATDSKERGIEYRAAVILGVDALEVKHSDRLAGFKARKTEAAVLPGGCGSSGATKLVYEKKDGLPTKGEFKISPKRTFYVEFLYETSDAVPYKQRKDAVILTNGKYSVDVVSHDRTVYAYRLEDPTKPARIGVSFEPSVRTFAWWSWDYLQGVKRADVVPAEALEGDYWFEVVKPDSPVRQRISNFRYYEPSYEIKAKPWKPLPPVADPKVPKGAAALGLTRTIIDETPKKADICPDPKRDGKYKWYSGIWYLEGLPLDRYEDVDGALKIIAPPKGEMVVDPKTGKKKKPPRGGMLVSCPRSGKDRDNAQLPYLDGAKPFYIEWEISLSSNDPDHYLELWLMPNLSVAGSRAHYDGDPVGPGWQMERWLELDVEESGLSRGVGLCGTVHNSWQFGHPNMHHLMNGNHISKTPIDRTKRVRYGASFDPATLTVKWYIDDEERISASYPQVPAIMRDQKSYIIMGAAQRQKRVPYEMFVHRIRVYAP